MGMKQSDTVFIAGHRGMVGSAIERRLRESGYGRIVTRTHQQLDLTRQADVASWFRTQHIDCVILAAARVGGISANNTYRAEFIYQNLMIQSNVIHSAFECGVKKLLFLGSSCIYPRDCPQPMREEYLLTGPLEHTNEPYAMAKLAGLKMCQAYNDQYGTRYVSVMPTNLYGTNDNFDLSSSHVLPAMIRKVHEAKVSGASAVELWGSGRPLREFLHVDDLADACLRVLEQDPVYSVINVGSGKEISIRGLAELVCSVLDYSGELVFDDSKPDGTPRKLLDIQRVQSLGWRPTIALREGVASTHQWYVRYVHEAA